MKRPNEIKTVEIKRVENRTAMTGDDASIFDPMMCPLLAGLSPEEQAERMEQDPAISACIRRLGTGTGGPNCCSVKRAHKRVSTIRS